MILGLGRIGSRSSISSPRIISNFTRFLSSETKLQIEGILKTNKVVVFMKGDKADPQCGFSRAVVQILELQKVKDYHTVDILQDAILREGIKEYSEWPTIPQVYLDNEFLGGCDIMISLHQSGKLEEQLIESGVISAESS